MRTLVCGFLFTCSIVMAVERGQEIRLWPTDAESAPDVFEAGAAPGLPRKFTVVHHPSIYVFLPAREKANGAAVVVAPGGGHSQLVIDKEGWEMADWLNQHGIAAFVLKYRLARAPASKYTVEKDALEDSARAMRMVRSRAKEWGVDPARVGYMGFSAGGYLAALIETRFDKGNDSSQDPIERQSSRPDFAVAVYPGYRDGSITVPPDAPPTFLVCTDDDPSHVVTTVNLYLALQKQKIPSEMHIYAAGGHGFGLRDVKHPVTGWPERLREWLSDRKLM
jgi:endo-1,4-beta-xylanase